MLQKNKTIKKVIIKNNSNQKIFFKKITSITY
jgi:hypothetical protein